LIYWETLRPDWRKRTTTGKSKEIVKKKPINSFKTNSLPKENPDEEVLKIALHALSSKTRQS